MPQDRNVGSPSELVVGGIDETEGKMLRMMVLAMIWLCGAGCGPKKSTSAEPKAETSSVEVKDV